MMDVLIFFAICWVAINIGEVRNEMRVANHRAARRPAP